MCLSDVWRVNVNFSAACSYIQHLSFRWWYNWHGRIRLMAGFDPVLLVRAVFYYWPTRDIFCEATSTSTLPPWRLRWRSRRTGPANGSPTFIVASYTFATTPHQNRPARTEPNTQAANAWLLFTKNVENAFSKLAQQWRNLASPLWKGKLTCALGWQSTRKWGDFPICI